MKRLDSRRWAPVGLAALLSLGAGCERGSTSPGDAELQTRVSALEYGPDLVVTEVRGPASVRMSEPFTATVRVCNQGTAPATNYSRPWVELYLSMDATLSMPGPGAPPPGDQRMIGSVDFPSLEPGQCAARTLNVSAYLPPDAMGREGAYFLGAFVDATQSVQELREDNNAYARNQVGVGSRSDLVVTELRGPTSVHQGDSFTATAKVCNQGTAPTGSSQTRLELYLSTDALLTVGPPGPGTPPPADQRMVGSVDLPPLMPGQCVTRGVPAFASLPPEAQGMDGAYFLGAVVDPFQAEPELREDNNAFVSGLMGVGHRADLVVEEVSAPVSVRFGEQFTATVKVCNRGTAYTSSYPAPRLEVHLSMDTSLSAPSASGPGTPPPTDQYLAGWVELQQHLAPGQCVTRGVPGIAYPPMDAQGAEGGYYVGAYVDTLQAVQELREDNNSLVGGLVGVGNLADLVVTQVSGPVSVTPGGSFMATVKVCNQGTASTGNSYQLPRLELYLSTDATLDMMPQSGSVYYPTEQRMVSSLDLPPLEAGRCVTRSLPANANLPPDAQGDGAYFLGAIVDNVRSVRELREDNNTHTGGLMGVGHRADLVVTEVKGPASVRPGDSFLATVKVCNQGTVSSIGPSGPARLELYLSTVATLTPPAPGMPPYPPPTTQAFIGSLSLDGIEPGQCVTRSTPASTSLPPEARVPGALYLGAIIDAHGGVPELREDNNAFSGGLLGVGDAPDLTVMEVSGPDSVQPGAPFTATVKVCNQGTAFSGSYPGPRLEVYLSVDASVFMPGAAMPASPPPGDQSMVGSVEVDPLAPGQCTTLGVPVSAYVPPEAPWNGALYLAAGIDALAQVVELREDNNVNPGGLMGVGHRADLVVAEVVGPASVRPGQPFSTQVKVCNQGTVGTSGYGWPRLELYLSTGNTLTPSPVQGPPPPPSGDVSWIASVDVQPLSAGQCVTLSVSGTASPPPEAPPEAPLFLGAIIDAYHSETELREDNNVRMGGLVGVGYRSDLVVKEVRGPPSVQAGQPITVTVRVCNQGTTHTYGQSQVYLYLSTDTALSMPGLGMPPQQRDQAVIGSFSLDPLAEGQCVIRSLSAPASPPPDAQPGGVLYLGAIADVHQSETELREDNNAWADFALQLTW